MELAIELGVDNISTEDGFEMFTAAEDYNRIRDELEEKGLQPEVRELAMIPQTTVELGDNAGAVLKLVDAIEDQDDVQNVWTNFEVDDAVLAAAEMG